MSRTLAAVLSSVVFAGSTSAGQIDTLAGPMQAKVIVTGLFTPWAFDFLPDGTILLTERDGELIAVKDGARWTVTGTPLVWAEGQGGLLDVLVPRDFAQSREVFLTFAQQSGKTAGTAVFRARLSDDGKTLENGTVIFEMKGGNGLTFHFGSRLAEAPDGNLFVTIGDRGDGDQAQKLRSHNGSVLRITRDGAPAQGNPFDGWFQQPEIWSYGHRNPQGMAIDSDGQLWINEHGAKGGDEVNRIEKGANYGWPVISYGTNYDGSKIGQGTEKDGMMQPVHFWDPSIAPSGMTFYYDGVDAWNGSAFVGSLKFDYIARLAGDPLTEVEQIKGEETSRVRDLAQGPDGALWFLSVGNGALYRLAP